MRLFDSHAHLTDASFATDQVEVLARAREAGVVALTTIGSDLADARAAIELASASTAPRIFATAGVHPHEADSWSEATLSALEELAARDEVVAIGETGLDFHYENSAREAQIAAFRAQLGLAERARLPVVVHTRDADAETIELIAEFAGRVTGVLHCYTAGTRLLEVGLEADWYVSFSGIITFKSYHDEEHIRRVPSGRLLAETDSPYLAPVPRRGARNEPAFVAHVVSRMAEVRGEEPAAVARSTYENACRFYGLSSAGSVPVTTVIPS